MAESSIALYVLIQVNPESLNTTYKLPYTPLALDLFRYRNIVIQRTLIPPIVTKRIDFSCEIMQGRSGRNTLL